MAKKGRPKKPGPRHPGGQLVQRADRDGVAWRRILDDAVRLGLNPLIGTQLGRLGAMGELAPHEVETGFRIAQIYGRYDRAMGRRRAAASPSYESGRGGDKAAAESDEEAARHEAAVRAFGALAADLRLCGRGIKPAIEELCVEDRICPAGQLPAVKAALNSLSMAVGIRHRPRHMPAPSSKPKNEQRASGQQAVFASIAQNLADMPPDQAAALWDHFKMLLSEEEYQKAKKEREKLKRQGKLVDLDDRRRRRD